MGTVRDIFQQLGIPIFQTILQTVSSKMQSGSRALRCRYSRPSTPGDVFVARRSLASSSFWLGARLRKSIWSLDGWDQSQQSVVSIYGPLGYGPSTLPLRHSAVAIERLHYVPITPFVAFKIVVLLKCIDRESIESICLVYLSDSGVSIKFITNIHWDLPSTFTAHVYHYSKAPHKNIMFQISWRNGSAPDSRSGGCVFKSRRDHRQSVVSIYGPLGYGPSTLPLRHSAVAIERLHYVPITPFVAFKIVVLLKCIDRESIESICLVYLSDSGVSIKFITNIHWDLPSTFTAHVYHYSKAPHKNIMFQISWRNGSAPDSRSGGCVFKSRRDHRQSVVSIYGPLGYGPSTLPLRHSAVAIERLHYVPITPFVAFKIVVLLKCIDRESIESICLVYLSDSGVSIKFITNIHWDLPSTFTAHVYHYSKAPHKNIMFQISWRNGSAPDSRSGGCVFKSRRDHRQSVVSIYGPLGYGPSTLPLRHSAVAIERLHYVPITPFVAFKIVVLLKCIDRESIESICLVYLSDSGVSIKFITNIHWDLPSTFTAHVYHYSKAPHKNIMFQISWRNGSAPDSRSGGCVFKSRRDHRFRSTDLYGPLGYGPSTLPLRHSAVAIERLHYVPITPFVAFKIVVLLKCIDRESIESICLVYLSDSGVSIKFITNIHWDLPSTFTAHVYHYSKAPHKNIMFQISWRNGSAPDSRSGGCVFKSRRDHRSVVSIYGPLGYGPSTLPLRHSAVAIERLHYVPITPFVAFKIVVLLKCIDRESIESICLVYLSDSGVSIKFITNIHWDLPSTFTAHVYHYSKAPHKNIMFQISWRNGSAPDSRSGGCVFKSRRDHRQSVVSIYGPLGYGPSTLPLRHSAVAIERLHYVPITPFVAFKIVVLLKCIDRNIMFQISWRNGSAPDSRSGGCVFKSRRDHRDLFTTILKRLTAVNEIRSNYTFRKQNHYVPDFVSINGITNIHWDLPSTFTAHVYHYSKAPHKINGSAPDFNVQTSDHRQSVVSIYGPLGYGPSTLPLRHSAVAIERLHYVPITPFVAFKIVVLLKCIDRESIESICLVYLSDSGVSIKFITNIHWDLPSTFTAHVYHYSKAPHKTDSYPRAIILRLCGRVNHLTIAFNNTLISKHFNDAQQSVVSIYGPLGYGPSTLPLRYSAVAIERLHYVRESGSI
ncbi:hypothetical protein OUZ56_010207 [Daphnia magna]|uniref:Uncharacterized protein n=1 Tax=Daphnia magna TaxID=35525 RepID=A0ABR0AI21_9CRUS|nr:hypothetical protein OUZ56_010207 [Daphnia magna]